VPNRKLIKGAAIAGLPLCLGVIPIIIDIEFWKMNKKLKEYEELGAEAFVSDEQWLKDGSKRKRGSRIALSILVAILIIFALLILVAVLEN
jgi:cytoskeletal protein RodZ